MKRWIAFMLSAAAVLLAGTRPAAAAPSTTVPPDAIGVAIAQVNSSGLAVTLDAGASEQHDVVISNHTPDLRLTVRLTPTDATGNLGANAASWLAFSDDAIQLEPHAASTISMTVAVPHDTQPGSALAHVTATVESAVAAADGSPVTGTTHVTFPVAITVRGTPTAQIAVADVHRVDKGSRHVLAIVLRNYGDQGAAVRGHVLVATARPQTIPFSAELAPSRDSTLELPWKAPPKGTPADLAVDVEYGDGNVASWSSTLDGPPTTFTPPADDSASPPTTAQPAPAASGASEPSPSTSPWKPYVPYLIVAGVVLAGFWFAFEMRRSRRREQEMPVAPPWFMAPPGWAPPAGASTDAAAELAKQLVALTEIIVKLTTNQHGVDANAAAPRARSPDPGVPPVALAADRGPPPAASLPHRPQPADPARPAPPAPGAEPRPDTNAGADAPLDVWERIVALEHERRRLRRWMDEDDSRLGEDWPDDWARRPARPGGTTWSDDLDDS